MQFLPSSTIRKSRIQKSRQIAWKAVIFLFSDQRSLDTNSISHGRKSLQRSKDGQNIAQCQVTPQNLRNKSFAHVFEKSKTKPINIFLQVF